MIDKIEDVVSHFCIC